MIALMGLDAETGVFMLLFLELSYEQARKEGHLRNTLELHEAIIHGAVKRIRPKLMTVAAASMGLMPIMWSAGTGADLMKRVAAPMVGACSPPSSWNCWSTRRFTFCGRKEVVPVTGPAVLGDPGWRPLPNRQVRDIRGSTVTG
jgi:hypothetical protein